MGCKYQVSACGLAPWFSGVIQLHGMGPFTINLGIPPK